MSDRRPRDSRDHATPPLFEGADDVSPEAVESTGSAGLDRLVTRVAPRPKHWAMKWRPNDGDADTTTESDRHPARAAGAVDAEASSPTSDSAGTDADAVERDVSTPTLVLTGDSIDPTPPTMSRDEDGGDLEEDRSPIDPTDDSTPAPVVTSRTWHADEDETTRRHPATPSTLGVAAAVASARPAVAPRPRLGLVSAAGWIVAAAVGIVWLLQGGGAASNPAATDTDPVLARPAEDSVEVDLAREEIASLRHERARLMQEVQAAEILLEDHRRLAAELRESSVANSGAAVELGVLEDEARRWARRHEVAMIRMDELAQLLVEADLREATLAEELAAMRARLEALDASNGAD